MFIGGEQQSNDANKAASRFMAHHRAGRFGNEDLDIIIRDALSDDPTTAAHGTGILFNQLVEPLSDTFLQHDRQTLHRLLAQLITHLRQLPAATDFHRQLEQWNLKTESDFMQRLEQVVPHKTFDQNTIGTVKKIFVLSRVTLGADVLLNTPVIEKMHRRFPEGEIIFLGSEKNGSLMKGQRPTVRVRPLPYSRRDILLNRFLMWLDVVNAVREENENLGPDEDAIVVNTDSRFLQSGLLPVMPPHLEKDRYFAWLPSVQNATDSARGQGRDLLDWLHNTFGPEPQHTTPIYPRIHSPEPDENFARKVFDQLRQKNKTKIITMSFGVGGNGEKRIQGDAEMKNPQQVSCFESGLVRRLLGHGVTVVIDRGGSPEEFAHADALAAGAREKGYNILEFSEATTRLREIAADEGGSGYRGRLVLFCGPVGKLAALIRLSDLYIGYDSLGQHLAAAVGRDVITIFAGYRSELFPKRWEPLGSGQIRLVRAGFGPFELPRQQELLDEVMGHVDQLLNNDSTIDCPENIL